MKKTLFSLALFVATASAAQAQSVMQRLYFGVKGGGGVANFTGEGASNVKVVPTFSGGAFVGFKVTEHFAIEEDFLYSQKGSKMENYLVGGNTLKSTLGYGEVHLLLRYAFGQGGTGFFVEAGPTGSFLLNQDSKVENSAGNELLASTDKENFTKVVAGYTGGIGYQLANGLQVSARYNGDLMPVYKKDLGLPKLYNGVAQIQLAYTFGGHK